MHTTGRAFSVIIRPLANAIYSKIGIAGLTRYADFVMGHFWILMVSFTWVGLTLVALFLGVTSRQRV